MNKKKTRDEKRFSEAPLVRQVNGELKKTQEDGVSTPERNS